MKEECRSEEWHRGSESTAKKSREKAQKSQNGSVGRSGQRDRFIAPQQRGGGPGRWAGRLAPHFRTKMCLAGRQTPVRLRKNMHWRVKVPLWRSFPPRVESNCIAATRCGEQLETKG